VSGVAVVFAWVAEANDQSWFQAARFRLGWVFSGHVGRLEAFQKSNLLLRGGLGSRSSCFGGWFRLSVNFWLFTHNDDDVSGEFGANSSWELNLADVDGFAKFEGGDVNGDMLWKIFWKAADFERVVDGFNEATKLDARGFTGDFDWHFRVDFFVHRDGVEVDVRNAPFEVVMLDFLHERKLFAVVELQADQDVIRGTTLQDFGEDLGIHLNVEWGNFAAINDSWCDARLTQTIDGAGAGCSAGLSDEVEYFGHGSIVLVNSSGVGKRGARLHERSQMSKREVTDSSL